MISRFLPGLNALYDRISSEGDANLSLTLLLLAGIIIAAAFLLPTQLKPLAIAYILFP